jgi:hypothetical protein
VRAAVPALLLFLVTAASAHAALAPTLVSFRQTGGFAGLDRGFVVTRSGAVISDGMPLRKAHLTKLELANLKRALVKAGFTGLARVYRPEQPIADGFTYRLVYSGSAVAIDQGAHPPPRLQRVFDLLRRLVRG